MKHLSVRCPICQYQQEVNVQPDEQVLIQVQYVKHRCENCEKMFELCYYRSKSRFELRTSPMMHVILSWGGEQSDYLPAKLSVTVDFMTGVGGEDGLRKLLENKFHEKLSAMFIVE